MDGAGFDDDVIRRVLRHRVWAVVGCSPDPERPSNRVARFLLDHGKVVVPVNPACDRILERECYASLAGIPGEVGVEVVDLFRRSELAGRHVDEAIELRAVAVWMQLGVIDAEAAERGRNAGLDVIMDRCPAIEWPRLMPGTAAL
jgi:predicted CoA-binding protein